MCWHVTAPPVMHGKARLHKDTVQVQSMSCSCIGRPVLDWGMWPNTQLPSRSALLVEFGVRVPECEPVRMSPGGLNGLGKMKSRY